MSTKYDIPTQYYHEARKYNELVLKDGRTSTGSGSFTSTTSGAVYNYTNGENDLFNQLQVVLRDYMILAVDWNNIQNAITASDVLAKIKTVDGSGSGLDADLLDGVELSTIKNDARKQNTEFIIETRASDPSSPAVGRMWLRTDL